MIVGVGIDLVATARIEKLLGKYPERFAEKVFTPAERAYCAGKLRAAEHYGARFAAKEACVKLFPRDHWIDVSHRLILHGRYVCKARSPDCAACVLADACPSSEAGA